MKLTVNSAHSLAQVVSEIKEQFAKKKYLRINITAGRDRSSDQNRLFHEWIQQLVIKGGEHDFDGYRDFCRLHFFVPVLINENEAFGDLWWNLFDKTLARNRDANQYCIQLKFVHTITGISSICTTKQFSTALESMQKHFALLETDPVFLEFSEEDEIK